MSPVFRHYTTDDGLPNPVVTALTQSADGFLWIGTEGGLARWDGYRFKIYRPINGDTGALPNGWITALYVDRRGRLWIGTGASGLARYDPAHDRFITYAAGVGGLSNSQIRAITDDGARGVWVASDGGLDHVDPTSGKITSMRHVVHDPGSLPDNRVHAVLLDGNGTLWVGTASGLATRTKLGRFRSTALGETKASSSASIDSLIEDPTGAIWVGTAHHGAFVKRVRDRFARPVGEETDSSRAGADSLADARVWAMTVAGPHEVWLATEGQGIVAVDTMTGKTHRIRHDALVRQSLADDSIWALHRDRAGNIWVGTDVGVDILSADAREAALTVFGGTSNAHGLTEGDVSSLGVTSGGRIWAGLNTKGIDVFDPAGTGIANVAPTSNASPFALPPSAVPSLTAWANGDMFVATDFGLFRADAYGNHMHRVAVPGRSPSAETRHVFASHGRLWIGGLDDGLWSMDPDHLSREVDHFNVGRLTDSRVTTMADGSANDLWIGTRDGLNRLDLTTRKVERIRADPSHSHALANGFITTLLIDHLGRLWVGTAGGGIDILVRPRAKRPFFERLAGEEGLPDNNVDMLMTDQGGRIWASTDNGIAVIDLVGLHVHTLHRADGAAISAYWAGSGIATKRHELVFGGAGGLTVIRPERFRPTASYPKVVITRAIVGGASLPLEEQPSLVVEPRTNSVSVEFSTLDYSAPEQSRYAYRLTGFDRDWIETDATHRVAAYTNLPPGSYTLEVRGSNRDGRWSDATLRLPISVLPYWYQTGWFRLILVLLASIGVALLIRTRTAFLRRRQRELEEQVAQRTMELQESKLCIEQIAYHDALTALPNRRFFTEELQKRIEQSQRQRDRFSLLLVDLDHFKSVNDSLGHDAGDMLLIEAAKRIRAVLRTSDCLARLGGDEFAILLGDTEGSENGDDPDARIVCQRIVDCFASSISCNGLEMRTSASIGIAAYPANGGTAELLYKASDLALYEAKRGGRSTWRQHAPTPVSVPG